MWTKELVKYWCESYYQLQNYDLLPFENHFFIKGLSVVAGSNPSLSPYEETCDKNWEFDAALRKLGKEDEALFRQQFIDGTEGEKNSKLYKKFLRILREVSEDAGVC